jgi:hypothetical protein
MASLCFGNINNVWLTPQGIDDDVRLLYATLDVVCFKLTKPFGEDEDEPRKPTFFTARVLKFAKWVVSLLPLRILVLET